LGRGFKQVNETALVGSKLLFGCGCEAEIKNAYCVSSFFPSCSMVQQKHSAAAWDLKIWQQRKVRAD